MLEKEKKKRRRHDSEESATEEDRNERTKKRPKKTNTPSGEQDPYDFENDDDSHIDEVAKRVTRSQTKTVDSTSRSEQLSVPDSDQTVLPETPEIITDERCVFELFLNYY